MNAMSKIKATCLRLENWPDTDRAVWLKALEPANPFVRGSGTAARMASSTREMVVSGYGRYLSWLRDQGLLDPKEAPDSRISDQNLLDYLLHLQATDSPYTVAARLQQLGTAVRVLAPTSNYQAILTASYRLKSDAKSTRDKRTRVQSSDRTASLGHDLLEQAVSQRYLTPLNRAKMFRDGLLILFLSHAASRRKNLASIEIGRHLVCRDEKLWLVFEEKDMKGKRAHEQPLPDILIPPVIRYIEEYRPMLLACTRKSLPATNALWISVQGTQMTGSAIYYQVTNRTKEVFGATMSVHFFRDGLATTQATECPEHAGDSSELLGHANGDMVRKHYNQSNGIRVRSKFADAVTEMRRQAKAVQDPEELDDEGA